MEVRLTAGNAPQPATPIVIEKAAPAKAASDASPAMAPPRAANAMQEPAPSAEQLSQALKNINSVLQVRSQNLEFSFDSESARTIVTVTDTSTHEVIRQMPTKEAMEIAKALGHLQSLLIKQTA